MFGIINLKIVSFVNDYNKALLLR